MSHPVTERVCACGVTFFGKGRAKWCSDRCRKDTLYVRYCLDCGAKLNGSDGNGPNAPTRCLPCHNKAQIKWPPEVVIACIQAFEAKHGRPPTAREWQASGDDHPSASVVQYVLGGWNEGIRAAGFNPLPTGHKLSDYPQETVDEAVRLYRSGLSMGAVGRAMGIWPGTVFGWVQAAGASRPMAEARRLRRKAAA